MLLQDSVLIWRNRTLWNGLFKKAIFIFRYLIQPSGMINAPVDLTQSEIITVDVVHDLNDSFLQEIEELYKYNDQPQREIRRFKTHL